MDLWTVAIDVMLTYAIATDREVEVHKAQACNEETKTKDISIN